MDKISTPEELAGITNMGGEYELIRDIDLSAYKNKYKPIGTNVSKPFTGKFNGGGHKITNLCIDGTQMLFSGLFGYCQNAEISNLFVQGKVTGASNTGGIAGGIKNGKILNCRFEGRVEGDTAVGGIVGTATASGIYNCCALGEVIGRTTGIDASSGGIAGSINTLTKNPGSQSMTISLCYFAGDVKTNHNAGGICGDAVELDYGSGSNGEISCCVSIADIEGRNSLGGITGKSNCALSWKNCYCMGNIDSTGDSLASTVAGGIVGTCNGGNITGCAVMCQSIITASDNPLDNIHPIAIAKGDTSAVMERCYAWTGMQIASTGGTDTAVINVYDYPEVKPAGSRKLLSGRIFFAGELKWDMQKTWRIPLNDYPFPLPEEILSNGVLPRPGAYSLEPSFLKGDGSCDNPYEIYLPEQLDMVRKNLHAHYHLMKDIDLTGYESFFDPAGRFMPIGSDSEKFQGLLCGKGKFISGLHIDLPQSEDVGLFGWVGKSGEICCLEVDGYVRGRANTGLIAGYMDGLIGECIAGGTAEAEENVGGIAGVCFGIIHNCYSPASGGVKGGKRAGGIAGINCGEIRRCYTRGYITGGESTGGIAGINLGLSGMGIIHYCVSASRLFRYIHEDGEFLAGRIAGESSGSCSGNYGWDEMMPVPVGSPTDKNGASKTFTELLKKNTWEGLNYQNEPGNLGMAWELIDGFPLLHCTRQLSTESD